MNCEEGLPIWSFSGAQRLNFITQMGSLPRVLCEEKKQNEHSQDRKNRNELQDNLLRSRLAHSEEAAGSLCHLPLVGR